MAEPVIDYSLPRPVVDHFGVEAQDGMRIIVTNGKVMFINV